MEKYLTREEVAQYLGISLAHLAILLKEPSPYRLSGLAVGWFFDQTILTSGLRIFESNIQHRACSKNRIMSFNNSEKDKVPNVLLGVIR